jgi:hypothetical protein
VEGTHMLRSVVIDNSMLKYLAARINKETEKGNKITRSFLSNAIWDYEKKGHEND